MFKEDIDSLVSRLENLISTKTVVGEPIISGHNYYPDRDRFGRFRYGQW